MFNKWISDWGRLMTFGRTLLFVLVDDEFAHPARSAGRRDARALRLRFAEALDRHLLYGSSRIDGSSPLDDEPTDL